LFFLGIKTPIDAAKKKPVKALVRVKDANDVFIGRLLSATQDLLIVQTPKGYIVTMNFQGELRYYQPATEFQFAKANWAPSSL